MLLLSSLVARRLYFPNAGCALRGAVCCFALCLCYVATLVGVCLASAMAILTVCSLIDSSVCQYAVSISVLVGAEPLGWASRLHCSFQLLFITGA